MGYPPKPALLRTWLAPLFMLSIGLHSLLLVVPLPSPPVPPADPETDPTDEAAAAVDLLSISSLAVPETESLVEPSPAETPPPAPGPPAAPPVPPQPVAPEPYPEASSPPQPVPADPPPEPWAQEELANPVPEPVGFDPNRQAQLVGNAIGNMGQEPGKSNFDLTDQFPGDIWDLYLSQWNETRRQCFFTAIDQGDYTLPPAAADLHYLSRNIREIERTDIPRTFPDQTINSLGTAYCDELFFEVLDGGTPILWVSLVPVSPGGSTALVIIWQTDPRAG